MKKNTILVIVFIALAGLGVILFWVFGAKENLPAAGYSILGAGAMALAGLITWLIGHLQSRQF